MQHQQAGQPALSENDLPQLLQLLQTALSTDTTVQQQAEATLASLEGRVGFCSCLAVRHYAWYPVAAYLKASVCCSSTGLSTVLSHTAGCCSQSAGRPQCQVASSSAAEEQHKQVLATQI